MKTSDLNLQRGAVLAFSLVMLLLLTLAGTRMIQQNKQQLNMALNMREATQKFADAEGLLAQSKNIINAEASHDNDLSNDYFPADSKLTIYHPKHQCTPTAGYNQNMMLPGLYSDRVSMPSCDAVTNQDCIRIEISSSTCISDTVWHKCIDYSAATDKYTCYHGSGFVTTGDDCTVEVNEAKKAGNIDALAQKFFNLPGDVCYQPYDPLCANPDASNSNPNPRCRSEPPTVLPEPACPKEVYKIDVLSRSASGASREIISDHVVGCGT